MPTNRTENYLRLHLLNNESAVVLRATFLEIVSKTCNGDVDKFLEEFEQDVKTLHKLSYTQRKMLFPDKGRTNVDEWDVSLLCFILTNCCTLEGRIYIGKLRDLMKRRTSAFTDIDAFLAYNKDKIDEMRQKDEINQEQHNTLFPQDSPRKTILNGWGIHLLLTMLVCFCSGSNEAKLYALLQNCVNRDIRLHCSNPDLTEYLERKKMDCENMLQKSKISQLEYDQLFPKYGQFSDIHNWDNHLVDVFVKNVCPCLESDSVDAVNVVKQIRNEMVAHNGTAEIDTKEFLSTWTKLTDAIRTIINQFPSIRQEWDQVFKKLLEGPFDIAGAINILKEYHFKETTLKAIIEDFEHRTEGENRKRKAEYKRGKLERAKLMKYSKDIATKVQYLVDHGKNKDMYTEPIHAECIYVKIVVSSVTKEAIEKTERMLRLSIQNLLQGRSADIKIKTIIKLAEKLESDGTKIVDVQSGSVLLKVKCTNLKGITNLLVQTENKDFHRKIENDLRSNVDETIRLQSCYLTDESKKTIINDLETIQNIQETKKPLSFSDLLEKNCDDITSPESADGSTNETLNQLLLTETNGENIVSLDNKEDTINKTMNQPLHIDTSSTATSKKTIDAQTIHNLQDTYDKAASVTEEDTTEDALSQPLPTEYSTTAVAVATSTTTITPSTQKDTDISKSDLEAETTHDTPSQLLLAEAFTTAPTKTTQRNYDDITSPESADGSTNETLNQLLLTETDTYYIAPFEMKAETTNETPSQLLLAEAFTTTATTTTQIDYDDITPPSNTKGSTDETLNEIHLTPKLKNYDDITPPESADGSTNETPNKQLLTETKTTEVQAFHNLQDSNDNASSVPEEFTTTKAISQPFKADYYTTAAGGTTTTANTQTDTADIAPSDIEEENTKETPSIVLLEESSSTTSTTSTQKDYDDITPPSNTKGSTDESLNEIHLTPKLKNVETIVSPVNKQEKTAEVLTFNNLQDSNVKSTAEEEEEKEEEEEESDKSLRQLFLAKYSTAAASTCTTTSSTTPTKTTEVQAFHELLDSNDNAPSVSEECTTNNALRKSFKEEDSTTAAGGTTTTATTQTDTADIAPSDIEEENTKETPSIVLLEESSSTTSTTSTQKAEKIKTFKINCPADVFDCRIASCTVLPTGDVVVCDDQNKNVKLFDKHYTYRYVLDLPGLSRFSLEIHGRPYDSCLSKQDNTEVFVTVPDTKTIYYIKVGDDMRIRVRIGVRDKCLGITCCMIGIAVVSFDGRSGYIQLLQYDGTHIRRLYTSMALFNSKAISIMNGRQLVITDYYSSRLISIDAETGDTVFEYKDEDLADPHRVTSDSQDNIYVVGSSSNNVQMISCSGEKVGDILTARDELDNPLGLEYNSYNDTIICQPDRYISELCVYKILK